MQQLFVGAGGGDAPALQHQHLVRHAHRAQPLRDDEGRPPDHQPFQRQLNQPLGFGVDARGGVIQQQDARVFQQSAGDGDALLLPAGERDAALPDFGIVTLFHAP